MICIVRLYFNTGFNRNNIPDNPNILNSMTQVQGEHTPVPEDGVYRQDRTNANILQNGYFATLRIDGLWDPCQHIDYVAVMDTEHTDYNWYYFVTGVKMLSEAVAELTLEIDAVTTVGINNMTFGDGWCKRRIIPLSEQSLDNYQENVIKENWTPQQSLEIDMDPSLLDTTGQVDVKNIKSRNIVLSQANLSKPDLDILSKYYEGKNGDDILGGVFVPQIPQIATDTTTIFQMVISDPTTDSEGNQTGGNVISFEYPVAVAYDANTSKVREALAEVQSLGIESLIVASYTVPAEYIYLNNREYTDIDYTNNNYTKITGIRYSGKETGELKYSYNDSIENKKVFALYNTYEFVSVAANNSATFEFQDIYTSESPEGPSYVIWSDLTPNGRPYVRPRWYKGLNDTDNLWIGCVQGANWLTNSIEFNNASGSIGMRQGINNKALSALSSILNQGAGTAGNIATAVATENPMAIAQAATSGISTVTSAITNFSDISKGLGETLIPEVIFPYTPSIQSYVGNDFMLLRYRLSASDAGRLDKYLHMYGEAVDEPFKKEFLSKKASYDFVQTENLQIISRKGMALNSMAAETFNNGVRVWHVLPSKNTSAYNIGGNADAT